MRHQKRSNISLTSAPYFIYFLNRINYLCLYLDYYKLISTTLYCAFSHHFFCAGCFAVLLITPQTTDPKHLCHRMLQHQNEQCVHHNWPDSNEAAREGNKFSFSFWDFAYETWNLSRLCFLFVDSVRTLGCKFSPLHRLPSVPLWWTACRFSCCSCKFNFKLRADAARTTTDTHRHRLSITVIDNAQTQCGHHRAAPPELTQHRLAEVGKFVHGLCVLLFLHLKK